jgi:tRNA isopentenyl-2-thiomethyl-A-37 hydroxylase MiaE
MGLGDILEAARIERFAAARKQELEKFRKGLGRLQLAAFNLEAALSPPVQSEEIISERFDEFINALKALGLERILTRESRTEGVAASA